MSAQCELSSGWRASLDLGFEQRHGRTILARRSHRGPLVVQRPFYPEGDVCHSYILHPPGGVVGGDEISVDVAVGPGAHALLTTPASAKFYRSAGPRASQLQRLQCAGTLEWLPQDAIFFPGAHVRASTEIQLAEQARFIGWDVVSLGLTARNEAFSNGRLSLCFELWRSGQPVYVDRLQVVGGAAALEAPWGWGGNSCLGTLLACPARREWLDDLRSLDHPGVSIGLTLVDGVLVARCMGRRGEAVRSALMRIWQMLRPLLLLRDPVAPRIWAT